MKIIIASGTGFLGNVLVNHFKNDEIVVLSRKGQPNNSNVRYVKWDAKHLGSWQNELEQADVVLNLTGKSVDCRYTEQNKAEIRNSRIRSTRVLNDAIMNCKMPPKHFINASTATIYVHSEAKEMDEASGEIGSDFSMSVAKDWEAAFFETDTPKTLKTAVRIGIVLGKSGGAFVPLKQLTQLGFGGKCGNGNQFISWIHETDFASAISFIMEQKITGVVNLVAPKPTRNAVFMQVLRHSLDMKIGIPISERMLKLGAFFRQTEPELLLKSRNVIPARLQALGFQFQYGAVVDALKNLSS